MNSKIIAKYIISNQGFLQKTSNIKFLFEYIKIYKLELLLPNVLNNLQKIINREVHLNKNRLVSPYPISKENKDRLESGHKIKIDEESIDKDIITGYKLYTKDKIIDASLETLLKNFTKGKQ